MIAENKITIDLLRHGKTVAGAGCFLGSTDAVLSELGWQQMHAAVKAGSYQRIICSPLKRCAEFSQKLSKKNNLPLMIEDDLREIHFGDWEEQSIKKLWQTQEQLISNFWNDPENNTPPNGEKLTEFQDRVAAVFNKIINENKEEKILMVIHGGVIRQLLANILSVDFKTIQKISIDYAGLTRLDCYAESINVKFINHRMEKN